MSTQILFAGMGRLSENSVVSIKNKSHSLTAELDVPKSGAEGVIIAQGGSVNGWSFYAKGGKLKYCYNFFGIKLSFVEATQPIPVGKHQARMEFKYDGGGLGKGGDVTLYVDGKKGWQWPSGADGADGLLRRRDARHWRRVWVTRVAGLWADG